jgi:hypothetical protein
MRYFNNLNMRLCVLPLNNGNAINNSLMENPDFNHFQSPTQILKFNMNIFLGMIFYR